MSVKRFLYHSDTLFYTSPHAPPPPRCLGGSGHWKSSQCPLGCYVSVKFLPGFKDSGQEKTKMLNDC